MKFQLLTLAAILAAVEAVPVSSSIKNTWSTLTPSGTLPESASAITSYDGSFALSIRTISASVSAGISFDKRDVVSQIADGQIQAGTSTQAASTANVINQISDGQIQQQSKTTANVINQISDGQVQQQTKTTANVVNQISDGQIQQQTKTTANVVNQISDGQVQQQTKTTASVVNQISDGQVQQQTKTKAASESVINQISDGQVQQHTSTATANVASQVSDGQVQATGSSSSSSSANSDSNSIFGETCIASDALTISLEDGELRDSKGRVGAIVANRQFQFDGPPPQAGTIYAAGWSFVPASYVGEGEKSSDTIDSGYKLALGNQTTFFKCLSGDFYNLYDALNRWPVFCHRDLRFGGCSVLRCIVIILSSSYYSCIEKLLA